MSDLADLNAVAGTPLSESQIQAILNQIDLDVLNLLRDGKLSTAKYGTPGPAGESMDRASALLALLAAREKYEILLRSQPGWHVSQGSDQEGAESDG